MKIRQGDQVEILKGKDKGKRGTVSRVIPESDRVVVEGINIVKRHTRPRPPANPQQAARQSDSQSGGVIEKEAPIHVSNVALVSPGDDSATRVGYRFKEDGRKIRVTRSDNVDVDK